MSYELGLTKESIEEFQRALKAIGDRAKEAATKGLGNAAVELEGKITRRVAENSSDTGQYLQSISHEIEPLLSQVFATAAHAPYVEFGTRAHRPPFKPIYEWAWRKRKDIGLKDKEVSGFAMAVVDKIARQGTKPKHDWLDSIEEMQKDFVDIVMREVREAMK